MALWILLSFFFFWCWPQWAPPFWFIIRKSAKRTFLQKKIIFIAGHAPFSLPLPPVWFVANRDWPRPPCLTIWFPMNFLLFFNKYFRIFSFFLRIVDSRTRHLPFRSVTFALEIECNKTKPNELKKNQQMETANG